MSDEGLINLDLGDIDDGSDPVPEGLHLVRIKSAQKKHKEGSEYAYIDTRLSPLDAGDKFIRRQLFLTLSFHPAALWNLKRFIKAADIPFGSTGFHLEDFIGKELFVTVKHEPDINDPSSVRATVSPPYARAS